MVSIRQRIRRIFKKKKAPAKVSTPIPKFTPIPKAPPQQTPRPGGGLTPQTPIPTSRGGGRAAPTPAPRPTPKPIPVPKKVIVPISRARVSVSQQRQLLQQKQKQQKIIQQRRQQALRAVEVAKKRIVKVAKKIPVAKLKVGLEVERKRKKQARKKVGVGFLKAGDVVSGGFFTDKQIGKDQEKLNKQVETFNKQFGDRELTEAQFKQASQRQAQIKKEQQGLKKRQEKLDSSGRKKFGQIFALPGTKVRSLTESERQKSLKENKATLKAANKELQKKKINPIKKRVIQARKKNAQSTISKIESGKDVRTGVITDIPLFAPSALPFGATKLKVVFVGSQTTKGGKIITTVALKSNKGVEGFATGVTSKIGKTSVTVTKGRFGTRAVKLPTAKTGIVKKKAFLAVEEAVSKKDVFALKKTTDILQKSKKKIKTTETNIKGLIQAGKGRVLVARGNKLVKTSIKIPSGKLVTKKKKGLTIDDFSSLAAIIPKKDLSIIIGRTITKKGDKAKFIGLIKGSGKLGKGKGGGLSGVQQQQFKKALKTVLSSATSAVAKADKAKGLTKAQKLALAATSITPPPKRITPKRPTPPKPSKPKGKQVTTRPRFQGVPASQFLGRGPQFEFQPGLQVSGAGLKTLTNLNKQIQQKGLSIRQKSVIRGRQAQVRKQLSNQFSRSRQRFLQQSKARQKQLSKQLQDSRLTQQQRGLLKQRSKLLQKQVAKVKLIRVTPSFSLPRFAKLLKPIPLPRRKRGIIKRKKVSKVKQSYNVKARPRRIKGRKIPKQIKVNKVPLSKRDAMNLRNKILDQSLARTGSIVKTRGKPQKPKLPVRKNFAKATKPKFRTHKSVKGKRVPLPKGRVIEKSRHLLDTRSEKKQIGLRKRIAQLNKQAQAKVRTKRKLSPKQLAALAQGRKKRSQNVRRRKK